VGSQILGSSDRIKMEKEKVKGVLDWPTLHGVKDV